MRNRPNRGLAGKARHVHYQSRAARIQARQMIDEYLEPASDRSEALRDRPIPIGHLREFLPSASATSCEAAGRQLELPLMDATRNANGAIRVNGIAKGARNGKGIAARLSSGQVRQNVIPRPGRAGLESRTAANRPLVTGLFTFRGFLYGCAVGGVAAAIVLLLIQAVVG